MARHRTYVRALEAIGVDVHLARFFDKNRKCPKCKHQWKGHEEKQTDVHLALKILSDAIVNHYERALIISRDSDLVPAARAVKELFPDKEVYVVAPPNAGHSTEMVNVCDGKHKIKTAHLDRCILPDEISDGSGSVIKIPDKFRS